jgi:regulator of sirC expression with transglutaminase-like and TPR domain
MKLPSDDLADEFWRLATSDDDQLAAAALQIARLECRHLDVDIYLDALDRLGTAAGTRLASMDDGTIAARVRAISAFLFVEEGFTGNRNEYEDPRNSFLNVVLERRTGIPISLGVLYVEVAKRAGIRVAGVNFPGHFLLRCDDGAGPTAVIDPFHGGTIVSEQDRRELLREHAGPEVAYDAELLAPASRRDILVRMLSNLKRVYVRMHSFPHARACSSLMLSIAPDMTTELRDRGLLAYQLGDFPAALKDLEEYLRLTPRSGNPEGEEERSDLDQIWEHVKGLRRRVVGFN